MARRVSGPGPAAYKLPSAVGYAEHDIRRERWPQYSFGSRHRDFYSNVGPGPATYKLGNLTRFGKGGGLGYTIAPMTRPPTKKTFGPGPNEYDIHLKPFPRGERAPAYSFGTHRSSTFNKYVPAPNAYNVETGRIKRSIPAFSLGAPIGTPGKDITPGPAAYPVGDLNFKLNRAPAYSMSPRLDKTTKNVAPGPNYYNLMDYRPGKPGHGHSFGIRYLPSGPSKIVRCDNM